MKLEDMIKHIGMQKTKIAKMSDEKQNGSGHVLTVHHRFKPHLAGYLTSKGVAVSPPA